MLRKVKIEEYFPSVLANAREFQNIADSENPEFARLRNYLHKWFLNTFVYDLDVDGAERWENMFSIVPKSTDNLDKRKKRILAKLNSMLPYTHRRLVEMFNAIYGEGTFAIELNYDEYELRIDLSYPLLRYKKAIKIYLRAIVPANLVIIAQNRKVVPQKIFVGTYMRKTKHYVISTSTDFALNKLDAKLYAGVHVRKVRYYHIGGI